VRFLKASLLLGSAGKIILCIVVYTLVPQWNATSDAALWYIWEARAALAGLRPYADYPSNYSILFGPLLALPGSVWNSVGAVVLPNVMLEHMVAERFGFDVEMLYLARRLGYRVREVPVIWRNSPHTRVRLWRDCVSMLGDVLRLRWHALRTRSEEPIDRSGQARARGAATLLPDHLAVAEETERSRPPGEAR
jgi:hypothetical protein